MSTSSRDSRAIGVIAALGLIAYGVVVGFGLAWLVL